MKIGRHDKLSPWIGWKVFIFQNSLKLIPTKILLIHLGQALWDFYLFQIHKLKKVHADPHPGNFLVSEEGQLIALDFGCMKIIPEDFYIPYFELFNIDVLEDPKLFHDKLLELEILRKDDSRSRKAFFTNMFHDVLELFYSAI